MFLYGQSHMFTRLQNIKKLLLAALFIKIATDICHENITSHLTYPSLSVLETKMEIVK